MDFASQDGPVSNKMEGWAFSKECDLELKIAKGLLTSSWVDPAL